MRRTALCLGLLVLGCFAAGAQDRPARLALVIGNGRYAELGSLANPRNDAEDVAAALRTLGFDATLLVDADLAAMEDAVVELGDRLASSPGSTGFFYYAGHGVQSGGSNYLIPADARIPNESFLKTKALSAQTVMDSLQAADNGLNIVVLDACRDNPFGWSRSGARGLSVVSAQPPGSIVVYATSAGSVAQDGEGRNGVFTEALLRNLTTPGLEVKEIFNRTGAAVKAATAGRQIPSVYNQFFDEAYLAAPAGAAAGGAGPAAALEPASLAKAAAKRLSADELSELRARREAAAASLAAKKGRNAFGLASLATGAVGAAAAGLAYYLGERSGDAYDAAADTATAQEERRNVEWCGVLFGASAGLGGLGLGLAPVFLLGGPGARELERSLERLDEQIAAQAK